MSTYSDAVLADSPAVYYRLGESSGTALADSSGNAHSATTSSSMPPGGTAGLIASDPANGSVTFDRLTSLGPLRAVADSSFAFSQSPMTVEFWINPVDLTTTTGLGVPVASGITDGWAVYYVATTGVWHWVSQGGSDLAFTAAVVAGVTQHVVFVFQVGNNVDLYINGAFSQTVAGSVIGTTAGILTLGETSDLNHPMKAALDEVALYTTALSAGRIAAHYAAALGGAPARDTHTAIPFTRGAGGGGKL